MPRLREVARADTDDPTVVGMYDYVFGDRDPVAEPGTSDGTPGNWWTVFALVPTCWSTASRASRSTGAPSGCSTRSCASWARSAPAGPLGSQFVFSQHCKALPHGGHDRGEDRRPSRTGRWPTASAPSSGPCSPTPTALVYDGGRVADGVFAELQAHLTDEEILELTYITALYDMHAVMSRGAAHRVRRPRRADRRGAGARGAAPRRDGRPQPAVHLTAATNHRSDVAFAGYPMAPLGASDTPKRDGNE